MSQWNHFARCATITLSALASLPLVARADEGPAVPPLSLAPTTSPVFLDETVPGSVAPGAPESLNAGRAPLMSLLDQAGIGGTLDSARINITGWVEGSYTYNFDNPAKGLNLGRVFDFNDNRGQINQFNVNIERQADLKQWDIGGMLEMFYGTDGRFTTSSDFLGNGGSEYYYDIPQLYVDITAPIGEGIRIRIGKFLFFKQIDPNASVFYSHSFAFGGALPFTLTGITAYYPITKDLSVEGGISRGWGQTFTDNNGAINGLGRIKYQIDPKTVATLAFVIGPELDHDNSHYRSVVDATLSYKATDELTLLFDGVVGTQAQPSGTGNSNWYGVSGYAVYKFSQQANFNFRGEVYRDENGFTTGISQTLFEITVGMTVTPFPTDPLGQNLKIRPEVRWDYSTRGFFNGLTDHSQVTLGIDAYFDF
jgi:hypothetical protein